MKAAKLEMGVWRHEAGGKRKKNGARSPEERGRKKKPQEVFLQIGDAS
ncbi:hypothetical protein QUA43_02975 [Microcoleus sp. N9_B4]